MWKTIVDQLKLTSQTIYECDCCMRLRFGHEKKMVIMLRNFRDNIHTKGLPPVI